MRTIFIGLCRMAVLVLLFPAASAAHVSETIEQWLSGGQEHWQEQGDVSGLIQFYAEKQAGMPYVSGLLDRDTTETLVVSGEGTDCVIFIEWTMALTATTLQGKGSFEDFAANLRKLRYRDPYDISYTGRFHYFTDGLFSNASKGRFLFLFEDETFPTTGPVSYMTDHRSLYPQIAEDDERWQQLRKIEKRLSAREIRYLPKDQLEEITSELRTGDVVAFVTSIQGLDVIHTALVIVEEGQPPGMMHASVGKGVITEERTLEAYMQSNRRISGALFARFQPDGWIKGE